MLQRLTLSAALSLCFAAMAAAGTTTYSVTINTSSISGTAGSLDFNFNPGPLATQAASVQIMNFASTGTPTGGPTLTGDVTGAFPMAVTFDNGKGLNDYFQAFTFGSNILFQVAFYGLALGLPDGVSTSGSTFAFSMLSSAAGMIPALTTDTTNGLAFTVNVNLDGTTTVTNSAAGNVTIQVSQVVGEPQTVTFGPLSSVIFGSAPIALTATASSGLIVSYTSTTPLVCSISGNTVTLVAVGTCSITAGQAGDPTYATATSVVQSFVVNPLSQTITFGPLSSQVVGSSPPPLNASESSGLPVTFTSNSAAVCTVSGVSITLVATGTCSITASQAGSAGYGAATPVTRTFAVTTGTASQTIAFDAIPNQILGVSPFEIAVQASSGLAISFSLSTPTACKNSSGLVMLLSAGTCSITASQAGDASSVRPHR
jgi:hypothetical protein